MLKEINKLYLKRYVINITMPPKKTTKVEVKTSDIKKNKSSYMFFCSDEREKVKEDHPEFNNKEIIVELGARWKLLKEENQERLKHYETLALEDKERFLKEKSNTEVTEVKETKVKTTPKKKNTKKVVIKDEETEDEDKQQNKKTKVNGYINFCKATRETVKTQNSNLSPREVTMELGKLWKELSNEEKESWKNV